MKKKFHIGCSSFYNSYWKIVFYPQGTPRVKWFEFYCTQFSTYEINSTFYKFPTLKIMENWFNKTPEKFLFSVKAPREITHIKRFIDCENLIRDFYDLCKEGLREKLGCILFQFPPSYLYTKENLLHIVKKLDPNFNNVIEFRHQSWWIPEVWNELKANKITFCSVSYPNLPPTIFTDNVLIYIRLHGDIELFYSSYSLQELIRIKKLISKSKKAKNVFIYFNNTASVAGVLNAQEMTRIIQDGSIK